MTPEDGANGAPRVVLLHGLGADRRAFQRFERLLPNEWDVRALDLLGHGDAPKPATGYSLDAHADHVAGEIRGAWADADANPPVIVGHSYGAATGAALAARHPHVVRSLVMLDPVIRQDGAGRDLGQTTAAMFDARRSGTLSEVVPTLYPDESDALRQWIVSTWETMAVGVIDELDNEWTRFADRITQPTTLIHGELELGGGGDLAADWLDDPVVVPIAGAGHYLHATHARDVAAAVTDAVRRTG